MAQRNRIGMCGVGEETDKDHLSLAEDLDESIASNIVIIM